MRRMYLGTACLVALLLVPAAVALGGVRGNTTYEGTFIDDHNATVEIDVNASATKANVRLRDVRFKCRDGQKFRSSTSFSADIHKDKINSDLSGLGDFKATFEDKKVTGTVHIKATGSELEGAPTSAECHNPHEDFKAKR